MNCERDVLTETGFNRTVGQIRPLSTDCVVRHHHATDAIRLEIGKDVGSHLVIGNADVIGLVSTWARILRERRSIISEAL